MSFKQKYQNYVEQINLELDKLLIDEDTLEKRIIEAMKYSLMAGGKRLRPVLSLAVADALNGNINEVIPYACAIEMIHTYSLIHDDLPCMDNDDLRRGRPTNHKVYGESMAVLAGDALLNLAYETMLNSCNKFDYKSNISENFILLKKRVEAMGIIARASGIKGMIAGQVVDMESEEKEISKDALSYMHKCKTGALIKSCVMSSAVIMDAQIDDLKCLEQYAENIGLAFQIKDDILDVEGDSKILGKPVGSDCENKKSTFITLYGLEESKRMLEDITCKAVNSLEILRERGEFLKNLAEYLLERHN